MVRRGFVYTIPVNIYTFRLASSSILHCVQHQNALRLVPKHLAFSTKTHCIQHQNALRLAAYCTTFSSKQPKTKCKLRFYAMCIHFDCIYHYPLFASEQTFARIDFLRSVGRLVTKKALIMLKFVLKRRQISIKAGSKNCLCCIFSFQLSRFWLLLEGAQ